MHSYRYVDLPVMGSLCSVAIACAAYGTNSLNNTLTIDATRPRTTFLVDKARL